MAAPESLVIARILGRNGIDPPQDLPQDMAAEVLNMDFYDGSLGRKRNGAATVTLNGFVGSGTIDALHRYLPGDDETVAELHAVESGALSTIQRLTAGTTWATYALAQAMQAPTVEFDAINFNGKFYTAYNSAVNRLHVYPSAGGTHRPVGIAAATAAPTATEAAGSVTDSRKYAVTFTRQESSVTKARSNLSPFSSAYTLTAENATVTRPTAPGDGETHWELYAYSLADNYALGYRIATTAIGTTTAVDSNSTLDDLTMEAPPVEAANVPPPSAKFLLTDGTHLIGAGAWETAAGESITPSVRMIWWTPALGTTDSDGDDERISNSTEIKTYLYVDEGLTGIGGPLVGSIYAFCYRKTYKLVPTGEASSAYQRITLRTDVGCIRHKTIVMAEDENGRAALYWLSHVGPYRAGAGGVQYIGRDMEDRWALVNLAATGVVAYGLFIAERHQIWWYVASGVSQNNPNEKWVYDCRLGRIIEVNKITTMRYGWARADGLSTESNCGVMFASTLGASMSRAVKPYISRVGTGISAPTLWKGDSGTQDSSTNYPATLTTKTFAGPPGRNLSMRHDAHLVAEVSSGVTITLSTVRDFGLETITATASLTAAASETRKMVKFEGASISEAGHVHFTVGDAAAANTAFVLDRLVTPLTIDELR